MNPTGEDAQRETAERRVRHAARVLGLRTREYVAAASQQSHLHDADLHAIGVLRAAADRGREVTAGDLAHELSLSAAGVTAMVDRMVSAGHAVRRRSEKDRRRVVIELTDGAHDVGDELFDPLVDAYADVLGQCDVDSLEQVADVMERLAEATRHVAEDPPDEPRGGEPGR